MKLKKLRTLLKKERAVVVTAGVILLLISFFMIVDWVKAKPITYDVNVAQAVSAIVKDLPPLPTLDKKVYDEKMILLAHNPVRATSSTSTIAIKYRWPVKTVYPNAGALLPFNRIVAYYGNFYSTSMGVLGEYPPDEMKEKLLGEVAKWKIADPATPVIPAIHYIVTTAQGYAGADGKYRIRMPDDQIQKAISLANDVHGVVFLDVQVGLSNVQTEVPLLATYLKLPNVHLAIDPEFSMKTGAKPGTVIGTMDATDINYAANFLAKIVRDNNLPPKILIVHRFTQNMVTNYQNITPLPEVQIVMDMDGWGPPPNKITTYKSFIEKEPVQFTGFKLFYKNDVKGGSRMLTPQELMDLRPRPSYIQYQ